MTESLRKRLLDRTFKYTKSGETDVAATFKRIRKQQKLEAEAAKAKPAKPVPIIHPERFKAK